LNDGPRGPAGRRRVTDWDGVVVTPVGPVGVRLAGAALAEVAFLPPETPPRAAVSPAAAAALARLEAYFADPRASRQALALAPRGTPFQRRVWAALGEIPCGSVITYGELARRLGSSPRAVGGARRANPWPILVPCHRVVAATGRGGYAGATRGPWPALKEWLLQLERPEGAG
jgi:methylated-DNA-[protein]-cysteine S-methyltransferase